MWTDGEGVKHWLNPATGQPFPFPLNYFDDDALTHMVNLFFSQERAGRDEMDWEMFRLMFVRAIDNMPPSSG